MVQVRISLMNSLWPTSTQRRTLSMTCMRSTSRARCCALLGKLSKLTLAGAADAYASISRMRQGRDARMHDMADAQDCASFPVHMCKATAASMAPLQSLTMCEDDTTATRT